jgi:hypothetical protein
VLFYVQATTKVTVAQLENAVITKKKEIVTGLVRREGNA